jgi:hypothetical protein
VDAREQREHEDTHEDLLLVQQARAWRGRAGTPNQVV